MGNIDNRNLNKQSEKAKNSQEERCLNREDKDIEVIRDQNST